MENLIAQVNIATEFPPAQKFETPGALISVILKNAYTLAGILLLVLLIFGGFSIIMGAGGSDPKKAAAGKKAITSAVIGFLIVFASYWIIEIIEKITGVNILKGGVVK